MQPTTVDHHSERPHHGVSTPAEQVPLRSAEQVMRLSRLGSFHQSRLSFLRSMLRKLKSEQWQFDRPLWRIDANGVGLAAYRVAGPERAYTLVVFAHDLPESKRSDRVIAEAWDATFTLFDGDPTEADLERLQANVPKQEAGRISESELVLSRANRSVRVFEHVVDCLSRGEQPALSYIEPVGYLMRTTAVYGSGKFGAADRDTWASRPEFQSSFQPEMLSVWLIRAFTVDLVEHMASMRHPETAVTLDTSIRQRLGVGNSTGLGMAPFLINHPALIHSWIQARESALAIVRSQNSTSDAIKARFIELVERSALNAAHWQTAHPYQQQKLAGLREDLATAIAHLTDGALDCAKPWDTLYLWSEEFLGVEAQEQMVSLMLEPHGELVDHLVDTMSADESSNRLINGKMSVADVLQLIEQHFTWALSVDYSHADAIARVWYVSEEKLEPRLGERFDEPIENYEQPLAPGRDACAAFADLSNFDADETVAAFLLAYPQHRQIIRRVQMTAGLAYAEIHDNTIAASMLPIDLLRCKLSFFGATRFDPKSDRWLRITLFQGVPYPDELHNTDPDNMMYPPLHAVAS